MPDLPTRALGQTGLCPSEFSFAHGPTQAAQYMGDLGTSGFADLEALMAEGVIGAKGLGVNEVADCLG